MTALSLGVQNTWAMSSHWQHFKRCLGAILAALETSHRDACEVQCPFTSSAHLHLFFKTSPASLSVRDMPGPSSVIVQVALVTYASAWPYSTCPLQGTQWSSDLDHIRRCIDGIRPSLGGCRAQPLLTGMH